MLYYLIEGYYTNYTNGLILAFVVNLLVIFYIASMALFKSRRGKVVKHAIVGLGIFVVFIVHAFSDFASFGGSGPVVVHSIENERFLVEEISYDDSGPFSHEYSGEIYYVDKSQFFEDKSKLILLPYFSNRGLSFKFKDETNLQIDLTIENSNLDKVYYEPIIIDLAFEPMNYKNYDVIHTVDTAKSLKGYKVINLAVNEKYAVTFRRLQAKENQDEGDYVITYGSIYQEKAEVLFNVSKGDFARFEFINDSTVEITYYSMIPESDDDFVFYYEIYNYKDQFFFRL